MLEFFPDQRDLILEQSLQGKLSDYFRDTKQASWQEIKGSPVHFRMGAGVPNSQPQNCIKCWGT